MSPPTETAEGFGLHPDQVDALIAIARACLFPPSGSERPAQTREQTATYLLDQKTYNLTRENAEKIVRVAVDVQADEKARQAAEKEQRQARAEEAKERAEEREAEKKAESEIKFVEDIAERLAAGLPAPKELIEGQGLFYENMVHAFIGHPEHGKTTVVMHQAIKYMETGGHVIWLDWDAGVVPTLRRMKACGASDALLSERLHLVSGHSLSADDGEGRKAIDRAMLRWPGALFVFDSTAKALDAAGLDENSPVECTRWGTEIITPIREGGCTPARIGHVTKGSTPSNAYERGAGSKLADTDVQWYINRERKSDIEHIGTMKAHRLKDREGCLPEAIRYEVGDGKGGLPLTQIEVEQEGSESKRDQARLLKMLQVIRNHSAPGDELRQGQIFERVTGRESELRDTLKEIVANPRYQVLTKNAPTGNGLLYWYDPNAPGRSGLSIGGSEEVESA